MCGSLSYQIFTHATTGTWKWVVKSVLYLYETGSIDHLNVVKELYSSGDRNFGPHNLVFKHFGLKS